MPDRNFLVFEVPAQNTKVGQITLGSPGCTVDLVGRPVVRDEGHAYLLHFVVEGIDGDARSAVLRGMDDVYEDIETVAWDPEARRWEVRGIVPVENIRSPALRFVAGLFGLADVPWILFREGKGLVRLYPRSPEVMPRLAEAVDAKLAVLGVTGRPRVEQGAFARYRERARDVGVELA